MNKTNPPQKLEFGQKDVYALLTALNHAVLVSMTDVQGNITYVNDWFVEISKYSRDELLGQNLRILKSGHQDEQLFVDLWRTISGGQVWRGEIKNRAKDGTYYWVDTSIVPILNSEGVVESYISVCFLITEKRTSEEALRVQNEFLEKTKKATLNILEDLQVERKKLQDKDAELLEAQKVGKFGTFTWDAQTLETIWSPEAFHLFQIDDHTGGMPPFSDAYLQLVHPDDREELKQRMQEALRQGGEQEDLHRITDKHDGIHWISIKSKTTLSDAGKPILMRGTFQDITKEKQIDLAKTEFVSLASHQLRTPLTAINWYSEMLINEDAGKVNAEQRKYLDEIAKGSKRMVQLVSSLLNVSRIELGTFAVDPESTDLIALVQSVLDELKLNINEKHLVVQEQHVELPHIMVDPKLMRIVYQNLITNAVKYTPEKGTITIAHTLTDTKEKGKCVHIEVIDTGIGIPLDQQDKIFKKLFRASNAQAADAQGTGLGLYIVKAIVEQAKGGISFVSKEGRGTTFVIDLPLSGMEKNTGSKPLEQ